MMKQLKSAVLQVLACTLMVVSGQVMAQAGACGVERDIKVGALDEATWNRMNKAYELVGEEKYDDAYAAMKALRERTRDNDYYALAILAQAIAQVEWARGDYDAALREFELAVKLNALPNNAHFPLMYQIAQLYFMKERLDESLEALELWFCKVEPEQIKASAYVLKASIYAQKEDWREVIKAIDQGIKMEEDPQESWYQLKLAAHFELEQWSEAGDTLEIMIARWPNKKNYWVQLSNTHFKLEDDVKALAVIALAHRKGLLDKQSDILYLSNLYSIQDVPFKAAEVMQQGIEDDIVEASEKYWTMVADAWYAAQEMDKALYAFEQAGEFALDGKVDLRRSYILIDQERWQEASEALGAALEKGGISDRQTGEAYLMKGMAEFNLGNFEQASTNWGRASKFKETKGPAQQWMNHMREERARRAP